MKNTLVFLLTEGIGLNNKWKGNYLKLAEKPNINFLVSGIYPWALISNDEKQDKTIIKKSYDAVKRDTDSNFYEMLYGSQDIKTYLDMLKDSIDNQNLQDLKVFDDLVERSNKTNSKSVHIFSLLSNNENKFNVNSLYFVINVLLKKGLKPVIHLITDGQEERPYSFNKTIVKFSKFLERRHTPVATVVGRNHVFTRYGHNHLENQHAFNYFETISGVGDTSFSSPLEYANENLANKIMDADIKPGYNRLLKDIFLSKNDSVLFLNSDPDDFATLASMIKTEPKFEGIYLTSLAPIYGVKMDSLFYENPVKDHKENLVTNILAEKGQKALVLTLNHKKGFVNKFFGDKKHENIERKAISTSFCLTNTDYYFSAPKVLIDKAIDSIGKYDVIFVHIPTVAEAAKTSNLKDLTFAIESLDKNIGRLLNFCRATGNIIAFTSAYGACEKMLDKHLNIVPYNKNSLVPFVFTNGDLSSKKVLSNFTSIYASTLSTLNCLDEDHKLKHMSLISNNFTKDIIGNRLEDAYEVWKEEFAQPLIDQFEDTRMNFYSEFSKDESFLEEKKQYVVLKEIIKIHEKILLSPDARKQLFKVMYDYITYNKIDFVSNNLNIKKTLETLFDPEINLQKLSKISNKYFDRRILNTNFKRNDFWVNKTKFDLINIIDRSTKVIKKGTSFKKVYDNYTPFLFFEKTIKSELDVLSKNDAVAIIKFYELIKDDVINTYEQYIAPRIKEDEEEKEPEQLAEERKVYDIAAYYNYFIEALEIIDDNKENATFYNKKCLENLKYLKESNKSYDDKDLFEKPDIALNPLVVKILKAYKFYVKDINNNYRASFQDIKKTSNKYDNNYNLKYSIVQKSKIYEGEFLEDVNMEKQAQYEEQFKKHFELYKEFDYSTIDVEATKEDELQSVFESEDEIEYDEEGNPIVVDSIEKEVRLRPEYDLTTSWVQRRIEEYKNVDKLKTNIALDAENELSVKKKFASAKEKATNYNNLSETWSKELQKTII